MAFHITSSSTNSKTYSSSLIFSNILYGRFSCPLDSQMLESGNTLCSNDPSPFHSCCTFRPMLVHIFLAHHFGVFLFYDPINLAVLRYTPPWPLWQTKYIVCMLQNLHIWDSNEDMHADSSCKNVVTDRWWGPLTTYDIQIRVRPQIHIRV